MATTAPGPAAGFHSEIREKHRRLTTFLESRGLSAVYLKRQDSFSWITGGHLNHVGLATEMGGAGLLITPSSRYLVSNCIEAPRLLQEEGLKAQNYELLEFPWDEDGEGKLIESIVGTGTWAADHPRSDAEDLTLHLRALRYELTPEEIQRYRFLGSIASEALEAVARNIRPGDTEAAVAGHLTERLWADRIDCPGIFIGADERIARYRHPIPTGTPIRRRAMLTANARKWGLVVSFTRFVNFGPVDAETARRYLAAVEIDCGMIAATRPGAPVSGILRKGLEAYTRLGLPGEPKLHHQGGAIGYLPREYRVTSGAAALVVDNQAFAWNPSITGVKSEDTILATAAGIEILTPPHTHPVMSIEADGFTFERPDILVL